MGTRRDFSLFFHLLKYMLSWWWFFGKCRSGSSNYECEYMYVHILEWPWARRVLEWDLAFLQMVLLHSTMSNAVNDYSLCWVNGVKFECNEIQQAQLWRRTTFDRRIFNYNNCVHRVKERESLSLSSIKIISTLKRAWSNYAKYVRNVVGSPKPLLCFRR